jgi:hypothetical protein
MAAGNPALRFYDLRHHAITELAEFHASSATLMAIASHVSRQMLEHYWQVRLDLKRKALDVPATRKGNSEDEQPGHDTKHDTNHGSFNAEWGVNYWKDMVGPRGRFQNFSARRGMIGSSQASILLPGRRSRRYDIASSVSIPRGLSR